MCGDDVLPDRRPGIMHSIKCRGWWAPHSESLGKTPGSDVARLVRDGVSAVCVGWWGGLDVDWGAGEAACVCVSEVMLRRERERGCVGIV